MTEPKKEFYMTEPEPIPGINYEVALELLGQSIGPWIRERAMERKKEKPSQEYIDYCSAIIAAIGNLREDLDPDDKDTINRIFNPDDRTVGRNFS